MATLRHVVLLVEDDANIARSVTQLLGVLGYDVVHVTSLEEGQAHVDRGEFCVLVTDLGILPQKESAKAEIELGYAMIEYARDRYPKRSESGTHLVPIIVLSAHDEHRFTREAFRRGIDDFLKKPLADNQVSLKDTIRECLRKCGREDHGVCASISRTARAGAPSSAPDTIDVAQASPRSVHLELLAEETKRNRTVVVINGRRAPITNVAFLVLLRLVDARERGLESLSKEALGALAERGFRGVALLQDQLAPYVGGVKVYKSIRGVGYALADEITATPLDRASFAGHSEHGVRTTAAGHGKESQGAKGRLRRG